MFDLKGKTALVTGSTQGIGFAIAKLLAENGAKVFVHGRSNMEKCISASSKIKNSVPVVADLEEKGVQDNLYELTGGVDILVLNASVQVYGNIYDASEEDFDRQFSVNVRSSLMLMQKYLPYMKEKGWGRIITVGSVNQYNRHPKLLVYSSTKVAQMKMVETVAKEVAEFGITVNNFAQGLILTPRNENVLKDEEYKKQVMAKIPCGFCGEAEDVAPTVLLLASDEGRYITGTDIVIDGGMHL